VTSAVLAELQRGRDMEVNLPNPEILDWIRIRDPSSLLDFPSVCALDAGEAIVLALAMETRDSVAILDDRLARRVALQLGIKLTGTLGILVDAKRMGLIPHLEPLVLELEARNFRVSVRTRNLILRAAGE
jgi:predicted nucleic acid-binding protein